MSFKSIAKFAAIISLLAIFILATYVVVATSGTELLYSSSKVRIEASNPNGDVTIIRRFQTGQGQSVTWVLRDLMYKDSAIVLVDESDENELEIHFKNGNSILI